MRHSFITLLRHALHNTDGNILIVAAVAIPVLMVAAGLAIDVNRYMKSGDYIQAAVDQAALAAVSVDGQDRVEVATRFFNAGLTQDIKQYISLNGILVEEDFPPGGPLSVTVIANVSMKNQFGGFVGIDSVDIKTLGQAQREVENVEAVVTLASSSSMCATRQRITNNNVAIPGDTLIRMVPDSRCTNFEAMKSGVREFIDIMDQNVTLSDFKVGLVPYNFKVKMPNLNNIPPTMRANEDAGFYSDLTGVEPLARVEPLTSDLNSAKRAITRMNQNTSSVTWSRSDLASQVSALMLDPSQVRYFPGGERPAQFGDPTTQKVVIMMTDGVNTGCCYTNWELGNFSNQYLYFYKPYNDVQMAVCDALKAEGVQIFTILFDVLETDVGGREINNVFARCASGVNMEIGTNNTNAMQSCSSKQHCYNVSSPNDLIDAYRQIAQTFYKPVITQ